MKRLVSMMVLLLAAALVLTGCSGDGKTEYSVKVTAAVPYVVEGAEAALRTALNDGLPELNTEEKKMLVQTVSTGDTKADPMSAMAGMSKVTIMFIGKEIEILICDPDNAQRHGEGGKGYMPLDELFTAEEQAELGIEQLTVLKTDDSGNATGEESAPCGISLGTCDGIKSIFKMNDLGLYVIDIPEAEANIENIRTTIRYILSMK